MRPTYLDTELKPSKVLKLILSQEEFGEIDGKSIPCMRQAYFRGEQGIFACGSARVKSHADNNKFLGIYTIVHFGW